MGALALPVPRVGRTPPAQGRDASRQEMLRQGEEDWICLDLTHHLRTHPVRKESA